MSDAAASLYLDLLKRSLIGLIHEDPGIRFTWDDPDASTFVPFDRDARLHARDWPSRADTMIGMRRLDHLEALVTGILAAGTPGDLIETGVWRGGATIFMRGVLKAHGVADRTVWVADAFAARFPTTEDEGASSRSFTSPALAELRRLHAGIDPMTATFKARHDALWAGTSYDEVRERFSRYGLLDEQVRFLRGWFRDTLPSAPIEHLALLRVDGDLYDSTYDALDALHPRLAPGGYAIVDDYGDFAECRQAVHDYFAAAGIDPALEPIDDDAVFWQKR
jgi:hypothetical protein